MFTAQAKSAMEMAPIINQVNLCHFPPMGTGIYLAISFWHEEKRQGPLYLVDHILISF